MFSFSGGDLLALSLIIIISYWIAFKTGLADFLVPSNRRKRELKGHRHNRGTITWKTREQSSGPIIKKVLEDNFILDVKVFFSLMSW